MTLHKRSQICRGATGRFGDKCQFANGWHEALAEECTQPMSTASLAEDCGGSALCFDGQCYLLYVPHLLMDMLAVVSISHGSPGESPASRHALCPQRLWRLRDKVRGRLCLFQFAHMREWSVPRSNKLVTVIRLSEGEWST